MNIYRILLSALVMLIGLNTGAQITFPENGARERPHSIYVFQNARIHIDWRTTINGTLIIKDGHILAAAEVVDIPKGSIIKDLNGKDIYPSFIDLVSSYGLPPRTVKKKKGRSGPDLDRKTNDAGYWNEAIHPEYDASLYIKPDPAKAKELRQAGFGTVCSASADGIARGSGVLICLGDGLANEMMLKSRSLMSFSFDKGSCTQSYPSSLMGSIALLRQFYYDSKWYPKQSGKKEYNISLELMSDRQQLPSLITANDYLDVFRADKIAREFGFRYLITTAGDCYKRARDIAALGDTLIVPLKFPKPYDLSDPYRAADVPLSVLKDWEYAPHNAAILKQAGVVFCLTAAGLKQTKEFLKNLRIAVKMGLSEDEAIKALTATPAAALNMEQLIGALRPGMVANFIICSDDIFKNDAVIYENWVKGKPYVITDMDRYDIRGTYDLNINKRVYELVVSGKNVKPTGKIKAGKKTWPVKIKQDGRVVSISVNLNDSTWGGYITMTGKLNRDAGLWDGQALTKDGDWVLWSAIRKNKYKVRADSSAVDTTLGPLWYPNMAFGWDSLPQQEQWLIRHAKIWTCDTLGIMNNADILITDGKIQAMGKSLPVPEGVVHVIDAKGMSLTPGIIDEHTHLAISRGVNESGHASSAEVEIGRVINPNDINIYRALAGGVVAVQSLHGSANPIGGQSAIIKLRWGQSADSMKISWADPFIKFALGENVKQSNWGDQYKIRFPQSRMGVEQVYYDYLIRAREYRQSWLRYDSLHLAEQKANRFKLHPAALTPPPRIDLGLEALAQVVYGERFITCHSYQQGEINMLIHVADSLDFKVNTFTHVLEGYKVADKIKAHGAAASTFSDWWAYKFEVNDATPYNATLLHDAGVVTAINSDDPEMGCRLNQEAAKSVKYGGLSEEEALKLVTINPAQMLHLDKRMGRINVGMDADVVLWSGNPLSIYTKVEKTFVDGIPYFDRERDARLQQAAAQERGRLMDKMMKAAKTGGAVQKPHPVKKRIWHCDSYGADEWVSEQ